MEKVKVIIDGREFEAIKDTPVLQVAHDNGVYIPHLCHNEEISNSGGSCRVCLVEAHQGGKMRIVTSCNYPVRKGLEIQTGTEFVHKIRKGVLELLLARTPDAEAIQKMAAAEGIVEPRFKKDEGDDNRYKCIACSLCTQVCEDVVGVSAISMLGRGGEKKPGTPFKKPATTCIGCGACVYACPTGAISLKDKDGMRRIWQQDFKMIKCSVCERPYIPEKQVEWIVKTTGKDREFFNKCPDHR